MTTNTELIERLRHIASKGVSVWGDLQMEAADALESQSKQIEALCLALETERGAANLYAKQILHWINKNDEKLELMAALRGMLYIVEDSRGVAGYHLNGDTAEWDEFDAVDIAYAAIAKAKGCST